MEYKDSILRLGNKLPKKESRILVTGATGLIGSCIIDTLIAANSTGSQYSIYALGRFENKIKKKFKDKVIPIIQDITDPLDSKIKYDYIIHCASNADPCRYAVYPVETILTNILGSKNVLDYCKENESTRMIFTSSFEVYGSNKKTDLYNEKISGIIDQTILRNGYPESKRVCELLIRSYVEEYNVDAVIVRLSSIYGPTMSNSDSKAHAQFIRNALAGENIILKSEGKQKRSYCYVVDAVSAIFEVLFNGTKGEVYNVSNENSVATIAEVAEKCAEFAGTKIVFDLPNKIEKKGFSETHNCVLDNTKLKNLGWNGMYSLSKGLRETFDYLKSK